MGLSGCTHVPESEFRKPLDYPEDVHPAPIRFSGLKNRLPVGSDLGVIRPTCRLAKTNINRSFFSAISQGDMQDTLAEMLEMQGYDIVDGLNLVLDEEVEAESLRAEYVLGGKIVGADADLCYSGDANDSILHQMIYFSLFPQLQGISGRLYLEIEWALFDGLRRKVVYKTTTKGYTNRPWGAGGGLGADGLTILLSEAFSMAAHNLGADRQFHDLVFYGKKPSDEWRKGKGAPNEGRPRKFEAQGEVRVVNPSLWTAPEQEHVRRSADNAVMVQAGQSGGSGFFITKEGHILTNSHVVGDALRVRVVTAHKKEKLVAEVLRSDKARDVALLRLEEMPEDLVITPSPIQVIWPKVSEDVYAVGTPAHSRMQDTVTKGIVSAHRTFKCDGLTANYIQSDVQTIGGNSGGPLLDAYGNIVGVSVSGFRKETESNAGLNLFIPISEALHYLDIGLVEE